MKNPFHAEILELIEEKSGPPEADTFLNGYLGNSHLRYPIRTPPLRTIAKEWMRAHRDLKPNELRNVLTSLIKGKTSTEKMMAGILMGYSAKEQRHFDPAIFDTWLNHLSGWAEVDAVCTGDFTTTQLAADWSRWKKLISQFSRSDNISKRRASLVLFCSPVSRMQDDRLGGEALKIVDRLKGEKEVMITKAISWVLRSMIRHYRAEVSAYLQAHGDSLPKIALRETRVKLTTGKKSNRRV